MLRSSLCEYGDAYIVGKRTTNSEATKDANKRNKSQ